MPEKASAPTTMPAVNEAAMSRYRATAERRMAEAAQALRLRRTRAQEVARQAAVLLREQFGAKEVILFGSTVHGLWFSATSDIDLAVSGLAPDDYFLAVAKLQDLSPDFNIDLVAIEHCSAALRERIMREGVTL